MITRYIYPYWLREKISFRLYHFGGTALPATGVRLAFAPAMHMRLSPADVGHKSIIFNGFYELALTRKLVTLAREGGLLVDVGANYGYFTLLWLAQQAGNTAVAFEASPANFLPLKENLWRNHVDGRVRLESLALSDRAGTVAFALQNEDGQTGWGGITLDVSAPTTVQVQALSLDVYWDRHFPQTNIEVLKIDVEGADTLVLQGASKLLAAQRIRHIFFEINRPRMQLLGIDEHAAESLLTRCGYTVESIAPNERYAHL